VDTTTKGSTRFRLNGWHRLWVVYSVLVAGIVIWDTAKSWPHDKFVYEYDGLYYQTSEDDPQKVMARIRRLHEDAPSHLPGKGMELRSPNPSALGPDKAAPTLPRLSHLVSDPESRTRGELVLKAANSWLAIVLVTYALGWSIVWIRRGFTRSS